MSCQDLMRSTLRISLHAIALLSLCNSFRLLAQPSIIRDYMQQLYGGQFTFLTVIGLAVSLMTFSVALLNDLVGSKRLQQIKTILSIVVVPAEGLITLLYWGIMAYDPSMLVPAGGFRIPLSLDLSLHFLPALFLWVDFLCFSTRFPKQANPLLISSLTVLAYTTWMEHTSSINRSFPYPFLNEMSFSSQRLPFYVCMIPVLVGLFHTANGVHYLVRGEHSLPKIKSQ